MSEGQEIAHAFAEASNALQLSREHADNDLAKAFVRLEKADQPAEIDPREVSPFEVDKHAQYFTTLAVSGCHSEPQAPSIYLVPRD